MASRIAGITIEIDGNTTKLQSSLKEIDKSLKGTQSQLKDVDRLLKFDPKNTELLTQKQKALKESISQTKDRLQELKNAQTGVAKGTQEWDALQREIIDTEQKLDSLEKEYKQFGSVAAQQIKAVGENVKETGKKVSDFGETLAKYVTLPIVGLATKGVASFAEVDKTMQLTNKTMGNTAEEAEMLDKAMAEAAANSVFGMNDAATATLNFARAGLSAEEAADALAPAMNLAAGEGGNLDTVSAGLVGTINGFGDSFSKTSKYADVFAAACNNSALDVDSLSEAMSVAAPIFNAAGYEVEDAALYMGILANNGIDAKTGANALKTGMARLIAPAKEGALWMEELGIEITNADGSMKDSVEVQKILHDSFADLSEEQQLAAASAIFGKNQMSNWLALINTAPEDVDKLSWSINRSRGTTDEMSQAMMTGFGGSIEKLKSSLDVLMTTLGRLAAEYLQPVIDKVQGWVDKFNALDDGTKKTIVKIAGIVAAIGPLLLVGGKLITGIGMLMTFAPAVAGAFAAISAPVLAVIAVIGGLVAAGIYLYKNWDTIKAKAAKLKENLSTTWENLKTDTIQKWENLKEKTSALMEQIKTDTTTKWENLKTTVSEKANTIKSTLVTTWTTLKTTLQTKNEEIKSNLSTSWDTLKTNATTKWESIKTSITDAMTSVQTAVEEAWNAVDSATGGKLSTLFSTVSEKFNSIEDTISGALETIKGLFNFEISFPHIRLPHFTWSWTEVGSWFSIPNLSIDWYRKAYDNPLMFTSPTVLSTAAGMKGFGDGHGAEIVIGLDKLRDLVAGVEERTRNSNVTINIIQQPWQDSKQLAAEVQRVLVRQNNQRVNAYA